jgi:glutathionylspermidine synthase
MQMQRLTLTPRRNWQATVQSKGFHFNPNPGPPVWDESVCYRFTGRQIDQIERATYALDRMCLEAVHHVVQKNLLEPFNLPPALGEMARRSWNRGDVAIYGRFDLGWDGESEPTLLRCDADAPTALLEAAVLQWYWMQDVFPTADQFNSIHDRLIEGWKILAGDLPDGICFTSPGGDVDAFMTANYLRDTAIQAGLATRYVELEGIERSDPQVGACFKLCPWDGRLPDRITWFEPAWKMLLSSPAILPLLRELYHDSPYLAPPNAGEARVVMGSWMINGYACGIGIREEAGKAARFVPHVFAD